MVSMQGFKQSVTSMDAASIFYFIMFAILLLSNIIFVAGIADQAQYGPGVCLLYIDDYHLDTTMNANIFKAYSPSCGGAIAIGTLSILAAVVMAGIVIYHKRKFMIPKRNVLLGMAALSSLMTLFMLIIASVVTAGLKQTCSQFISLTGVPCADVFADGFFANDATTRYSKNLGTVSAAIGAAWATLISWAILTVYQWIQWRNEAQRWW